jgi:hypothetical protein
MDFREKYLKYKTKYLQLKNMIGSGEKTARAFFFSRLEKNYIVVKNIFISDRFLQSIILNLESQLPVEKPSNIMDIPVFNQIFDIINSGVNSDYIDLLCKIYLTGQLGQPNSIENKGRLIDNAILFNKLKPQDRKVNGVVKTLNTFNSLEELETFISSKQQVFKEMEESKKKKEAKSIIQRQLKEDGENDVIIKLDTQNVIIYQPTSEAGAKFYGRNTRWCTAATNNNMFNYYNDLGPIYIIVLKNKFDSNGNRVKYQVQIQTSQFMNTKDYEVEIMDIIKEADDQVFKNYLINMLTHYINSLKDINQNYEELFRKLYDLLPEMLNINTIIVRNEYIIRGLPRYNNIERILIDINCELKNLFDLINVTKLKILILDIGFNQPLGDSLSTLTNLQELDIESNIPLGNSLSSLINLQTLDFNYTGYQKDYRSGYRGYRGLDPLSDSDDDSDNSNIGFNMPIGNSLKNLINLKTLRFSNDFNQPLGDSLSNLTNLQNLTFGYKFNQPLGDSLSNLRNLVSIKISNNYKYKESLPDIRIEYY